MLQVINSLKLKNELPLHAKAWGDKAMISTVLRNLISNAIKYTEIGGTIILSVKRILKEQMFQLPIQELEFPKTALRIYSASMKVFLLRARKMKKAQVWG